VAVINDPIIIPINTPLNLAELTLNENGLWLIQAKVNFDFEPAEAPTTGLVTCGISAIPVAGVPEGGKAAFVDDSQFILRGDFLFQFVPYQGIVTVCEPTRVNVHCHNFILEVAAEPVRAFNIRMTAMRVRSIHI